MGHELGASFRIAVVRQHSVLMDSAWDLAFYAFTKETKATERGLFWVEVKSV